MSSSSPSRCWLGRVVVVGHSSVGDVAEVSFDDVHGFFLGVAAAAGVVVDLAGSGFTAQLGDGDAMEAGVDSSVAAPVEAVSGRFAGALGGRRR